MDCPHCRAVVAEGSAACSACGVDLVKLKAREALAKLKREKPVSAEGPPWAKSAAFLGALAVGVCLLVYGAALIAGRSVAGRGPARVNAASATPAPASSSDASGTPAIESAAEASAPAAAPAAARSAARAAVVASPSPSVGRPDVGYNKGNAVRLTPRADGTWAGNGPLPLSPGSAP
jgi:hypothetical protein